MANQPYDPNALPPELRALLPNNSKQSGNQKNVVTPAYDKEVVLPTYDKEVVLPKSYAQVESMVSPQAVAPHSGGLKPKKKKRRNPLTVRLSKGEWEKIAAKAIRARCTLNSYARAAMLGSDYTSPRDPELVKALRKYYFELHMQGINLNQIAKNLNGGFISDEECEAAIADIRDAISGIWRAVGQTLGHGEMGEE
jgi:hypothetical protein